MAGKPITTGMVFFRNAGDCKDGRQVWSFCGIIATPPETPIRDEHQYVVSGGILGGIIQELATAMDGDGRETDRHKLMITIHLDDGIDLTERARGQTHTTLLQDGIWRV